jgi:UDP-glucose 4-epimerase
MSTYVITGVAGFLGSAVARELISRGATVRGIDNLSTGNVENLSAVMQNIDFHLGDICDQTEFARLCQGADCVIHYASVGTQSQTLENLSETNQNNIEGTLKVLVAAQEAKVRRVVLASSNSLYSTSAGSVKHESTPLSFGSAYAVSKRAAEEYARSFHRIYGLETVSLRYFHVYGPRQDIRSRYSAAVTRLISEILNGETPTIYGDGETVRDLVYIDDAVEATLLASTVSGSRVAGRVINVGSGRGVSLNEVFSEVRRVLDYRGVLVYGPERRAQVRNIVADTTLAQQVLGFVAQENLTDGITTCAKWVRRRANLSNLAVH